MCLENSRTHSRSNWPWKAGLFNQEETVRERQRGDEEREVELTGEWDQAPALLDRINRLNRTLPLRALYGKPANAERRGAAALTTTKRQLTRLKGLMSLTPLSHQNISGTFQCCLSLLVCASVSRQIWRLIHNLEKRPAYFGAGYES